MSTNLMRTRKLAWLVPIFAASLIFILLTQLLAKPLPKFSTTAPIAANSELAAAPIKQNPQTQTIAAAISPASITDKPSAPSDAALLIQINGRSLPLTEWQSTQSADQAMNQLLAISNTAISNPAEPMVALDRLINQELAWQAATAAGFAVAEDEIAQTLQQLLASHSRSELDLAHALAAQQVDRSFFTTYLRRMITGDRFVNQKIANGTASADDFLHQLRSQAHISFGPALASLSPITHPSEPVQPLVTPILSKNNSNGLFPELKIKPIDASDPNRKLAAQPPTTDTTKLISKTTASAASGLNQANSPVTTPLRGTNAGELPPQLTLPRLDNGEQVSLDDFVGKAVVLSFWVTWCPYCQQQSPVLSAAATRYAKANLQFVGVNVKEDPATVQYFVDQHAIPYLVLLDQAGLIAEQFHVSGFPVTYFLDQNGLIAAQHVGALSAELLDSYLAPLLD